MCTFEEKKKKDSRGILTGGIEARLRHYRLAGEQIEWLSAELRRNQAQEEELALGLPGRTMDGMPKGKGMRPDPTARAVEIILEKSWERNREVLGRIRALVAERNEVDRLIEELEAPEQQIIRMRWMEGKSWVQIAMRMYLCERQCQRIHRQALERMNRELGLEGDEEADWAEGAL